MAADDRLGVIGLGSFCPIFEPQPRNNRLYLKVARLPSRRWIGRGADILGSFINPAFLVLVLSDTGTGVTNPCVAAVERVHEIAEVDPR